MANVRQGRTVTNSRAAAAQVDDGLNAIDNENACYNVLDLESTNFATGFFGTAQEISANDLLGIYNAHAALKSAATPQYNAFRAALRKAKI